MVNSLRNLDTILKNQYKNGEIIIIIIIGSIYDKEIQEVGFIKETIKDLSKLKY